MANDPSEITEALVEDAISDGTSREILSACVGEARPVKEISRLADISQATAYRRVDALEEDGLLVVERSAITEEGKRYDLYRSRIEDAMLRVSGEGIQVEWRVSEPVEDRLSRMWERMRL